MNLDKLMEQFKNREITSYAVCAEIAKAQGVVVVSISPRKYMVIRLTMSSGYRWIEDFGPGGYYSWLTGTAEVTGQWKAVLEWLVENIKPIPVELTQTDFHGFYKGEKS